MEGNFNRHLGSKLRMRRLALGLTQTKVAQAINVTIQQIQKFEKGTIGMGRRGPIEHTADLRCGWD